MLEMRACITDGLTLLSKVDMEFYTIGRSQSLRRLESVFAKDFVISEMDGD